MLFLSFFFSDEDPLEIKQEVKKEVAEPEVQKRQTFKGIKTLFLNAIL